MIVKSYIVTKLQGYKVTRLQRGRKGRASRGKSVECRWGRAKEQKEEAKASGTSVIATFTALAYYADPRLIENLVSSRDANLKLGDYRG